MTAMVATAGLAGCVSAPYSASEAGTANSTGAKKVDAAKLRPVRLDRKYMADNRIHAIRNIFVPEDVDSDLAEYLLDQCYALIKEAKTLSDKPPRT
ncbi:hypothetical protein B7Z28_00210 [Candidatus Saccharibacteria bacterium 32-45-3]|nr:MAG: hypothetical protein B7Z28_00210 [Candidatus Saccharibacteria bacterium 32-45-3]